MIAKKRGKCKIQHLFQGNGILKIPRQLFALWFLLKSGLEHPEEQEKESEE